MATGSFLRSPPDFAAQQKFALRRAFDRDQPAEAVSQDIERLGAESGLISFRGQPEVQSPSLTSESVKLERQPEQRVLSGAVPVEFQPNELITVGQTATTSTVSGLGTPAELAAERAKISASETEKINLIKQANLNKDVVMKKRGELLSSMRDEAIRVRNQVGDRGKAIWSQLERASDELERTSDQIKKSRIDPTALLAGMPRWQQALTGLTLALESAGSALVGRRPELIRHINSAIEQDLSTQRSNISKLIQQQQMTERERDRLWARWQQTESDQRNMASEISKLQMAQLGVEADTIEARLAAGNAVVQIGEDSRRADLAARQLFRPRTTTQVTTQKQSAQQLEQQLQERRAKLADVFQKQAKLSANDSARAVASLAASDGAKGYMKDLLSQIKSQGQWKSFILGRTPGLSRLTVSGAIAAKGNELVDNLAKEVSGVTVRADERKRKQALVPDFLGGRDVLLKKWNQLQQARLDDIRSRRDILRNQGLNIQAAIFSDLERKIMATTSEVSGWITSGEIPTDQSRSDVVGASLGAVPQ